MFFYTYIIYMFAVLSYITLLQGVYVSTFLFPSANRLCTFLHSVSLRLSADRGVFSPFLLSRLVLWQFCDLEGTLTGAQCSGNSQLLVLILESRFADFGLILRKKTVQILSSAGPALKHLSVRLC